MIATLTSEIESFLSGNGFTTTGSGSQTGNGGSSYPSSTLAATIDPVGTLRTGTTVDFTGRNWGTNEFVQVTNNGIVMTTAQADGGGNFSTGSLPVTASPGTQTYTFTGLNTGITRSVTVNVTR